MVSLIIVLALTVPPVLKAVAMLKSNVEKLILLPLFLLLPNVIEKIFVSYGMNLLLKQGFFEEDIFGGTPLLVLIWSFVIALLLLIYYESLPNFIRKKEKRSTLRM